MNLKPAATVTPRPQMSLGLGGAKLPPLPPERERELVRALADLLLAVATHDRDVVGERSNEHKDQ